MSNLVKRQHFVPRTYLKHFGIKKANEHFVQVLPNKEKEENSIFESNIKNVALQRHLYTLPGKTAEQKMAIEKFYSDEVEAHYDRIYTILTDPGKKIITQEERELIISTVVTMYYRTTKWINTHNDFMNRVFKDAFSLCHQTGRDYFTFGKTKMSIKGKTLKEFTDEYNKEQQPLMVMTQLEVALKLVDLRIKNDGISVSRLTQEDSHFLTSDNPVIATNLNLQRIKPFDYTNILRLPLDNKHMLLLIPERHEPTMLNVFRNELNGTWNNMEKLTSNYQQLENSDRFLFGSNESLKSYLRTKEVSEQPMSAEEIKMTDNFNGLIKKGKEKGLF